MQRAAIIGLGGPELSGQEAEMLRARQPLGIILFARNIESAGQLRRLTAAIREELGAEAPILIDQEGGRVARLRPPQWSAFPPAAVFGSHPAEVAEANAALLAAECVEVGLNVVC